MAKRDLARNSRSWGGGHLHKLHRPGGELTMDPLIILFGLGVGILVGITGIGGGSLMTPLLILVFGTQPVVAIGTDLAYGAITKTVGGWRHFKGGNVDLGLCGWMAVGSAPGSLVGVWLIDRLHDRGTEDLDQFLLIALAFALI